MASNNILAFGWMGLAAVLFFLLLTAVFRLEIIVKLITDKSFTNFFSKDSRLSIFEQNLARTLVELKRSLVDLRSSKSTFKNI